MYNQVYNNGIVCRHIVASQVYGEKAASKKGQDRWLAASIDVLMQEYPTFRVAYMDKVAGKDDWHWLARDHGVTFSVLLRWDYDQGKPVECYRVRLPWQTEDKRGVVRARFSGFFNVRDARVPLSRCRRYFSCKCKNLLYAIEYACRPRTRQRSCKRSRISKLPDSHHSPCRCWERANRRIRTTP